MSIKAMTWVWEYSKQKSTNLLMLLAIADHCNDDGVCYPSVSRLAKKCRLEKRGAQKVLRKLESEDEISIVVNTEHQSGKSSLYYINGYRRSISLPIVQSTKTFEPQKGRKSNTCPIGHQGDVSQDIRVMSHRTLGRCPTGHQANVPQDIQTINIDPSIETYTHTDRARSCENENSPKKSVCVLDELNDDEKAAWKWSQSHDFWKGRITTPKQLKANFADNKAFRVQFEQTRPAIKPVNGKKVKLKETGKRMKAKDCPYCNERGVIEWRGRLRMDILVCPHNHDEIKQLAIKKEAVIGTAKPGYEDPAGLKKPKITPAEKARTRETLGVI